MELLDELLHLVDAFDKRGVEYALCGGLAVAMHGVMRATIGIDFLVLEPAFEEAKAAAVAAGFDFDSGWIPMPGKDSPRVFRLLKIEGADHIIVDLMLVNESLEEVWRDRILSTFGDKKISLVSRSGLIRMKSRSTRLRDQVDVESLNALGGGGS